MTTQYTMPFTGLGANDYPLVDVVDGDLDFGDPLENAVLMSLFTWRRAADDDALPVDGERQGWWADTFAAPPANAPASTDQIGSRLWLLSRTQIDETTPELARGYAIEALAWLVDDGIAARVDVVAERIGTSSLALAVTVIRDDGTARDFRFDDIWEALRG